MHLCPSNSSSLYISLQCKQRIFLGLGLGTGAVMQSLVGAVERQSIYSLRKLFWNYRRMQVFFIKGCLILLKGGGFSCKLFVDLHRMQVFFIKGCLILLRGGGVLHKLSGDYRRMQVFFIKCCLILLKGGGFSCKLFVDLHRMQVFFIKGCLILLKGFAQTI